MTAATPPLAAARRSRWWRAVRRTPVVVWVFLLIPFAFEVGWVFWPAVNSFSLSLTTWNGLGAATPVGLTNFRNLFHDDVFLEALRNNVIWAIGFGGLSVVIGFSLALTLNKPRRGVGIYRSAIYLPMVFSLVVTGLFWRLLYAPDGMVNTALRLVGLGHLQHQWLADPDTVLWAVLAAAVWRQVGYIMVLYLAGLKGCDPALDDAAAVDGANRWQHLRYVTLPQLRNVNTVVLAIMVIDSLRTFDIVWTMTRGGPYHASELLSTYMYQQGFTFLNLGYSSAIAVIIFVLAIAFIITYLVRSSRQED